ncbi:hypothetical protein STENM327S_00601 [Streptomyces tendae]
MSGGDQLGGVVVSERTHRERIDPLPRSADRRVVAGDEDHHRIGPHPPGDESEHERGLRVEPMCVVHDDQERAVDCQRRQQGQDRHGGE